MLNLLNQTLFAKENLIFQQIVSNINYNSKLSRITELTKNSYKIYDLSMIFILNSICLFLSILKYIGQCPIFLILKQNML